MTRALPAIGGAAVALAVAESAGSGSARDALAAIEITVAVALTLAVLGLLAGLVYRVRRSRLTYRPVAATRVRAEVVRPVDRTPLALPVAPTRHASLRP
jgi:hypothetical protein